MENLRGNIKVAEQAVAEAYSKLGGEEGRNVTLGQIEDLLASRFRALSLKIQDPEFRQDEEFGNELMKHEMGIGFSWQEELEVLRQAQGIDTPSRVTAAKTWFTRSKGPMDATIDIIKSNTLLASLMEFQGLFGENERRNKAHDTAIRVLDQTFKL